MLIALRLPKNRPYLHVLVFVLLVSWVSALVTSTCAMPAPWRLHATDAMPAGCSEPANHTHDHKAHRSIPAKDCSFQPCLDSQPNPVVGYKLTKPEMPVFLLCLIWAIGNLFFSPRLSPNRPATSPPAGRRISLIYRFCILLN